MLLSGLLFLLFYDGYLAEHASRRARILYVIVAIVSLYTQYYLGFQLAAGAAVLVATRRWRSLSSYLVDMSIAGLFFVPMLLKLGGQLSGVTGQIEEPMSMAEMAKTIYQRIVTLTLPIEWVSLHFLRRWGARIFLVSLGVLYIAKVIRERKKEDIAIGVFTVVLVAFFFAALDLAGWTVTQHRHMSGLILPLVMLPFAAFAFFRNTKIVAAWFIFIVLLSLVALVVAYRPLAKPGDFDRVGKFLMTNEEAGEPVLVFHADAVLPLRQYYKGQNQLVAVPQENGLERWDPRNNVLEDEQQITDRINSVSGSPERFWLVHDGWCAHGSLSFNCELLDRVIDQNFVIERTESFLEPTTVMLLRRK